MVIYLPGAVEKEERVEALDELTPRQLSLIHI